MEYLIAYYCKAEISFDTIGIKPAEYLEIEERRLKAKDEEGPVLVSSEPSRYEISSEIPSHLAARINPYPTEFKDRVNTVTLPSLITEMASDYETLKSSLTGLKDHQNCGVC